MVIVDNEVRKLEIFHSFELLGKMIATLKIIQFYGSYGKKKFFAKGKPVVMATLYFLAVNV